MLSMHVLGTVGVTCGCCRGVADSPPRHDQVCVRCCHRCAMVSLTLLHCRTWQSFFNMISSYIGASLLVLPMIYCIHPVCRDCHMHLSLAAYGLGIQVIVYILSYEVAGL